MDGGRELQHQLQLISEIKRRQMNPLDDGGGGKDDTPTARGDRPSIHTVEAPYNNAYHPQRGGRGTTITRGGDRSGGEKNVCEVKKNVFGLAFGTFLCVAAGSGPAEKCVSLFVCWARALGMIFAHFLFLCVRKKMCV
jgi:hypothetical protein